MGMRIDDEIYVHGYLDEIRQDKVIIRNEGGYFGTIVDELIEAIPKADYENRLKADLKAILVELQLEIEEIKPLKPTDDEDWQYGCFHGLELMQDKCLKLIQQKIDKLKEGINGENNN